MSEEWKVNENRKYTFGMDERSKDIVKDWYDYVDRMNNPTRDVPLFANEWAGPIISQMIMQRGERRERECWL